MHDVEALYRRYAGSLYRFALALSGMRSTEGRSYDDIAAALGLSAGAVRVRVHRARMRLARAIGRTLEKGT